MCEMLTYNCDLSGILEARDARLLLLLLLLSLSVLCEYPTSNTFSYDNRPLAIHIANYACS